MPGENIYSWSTTAADNDDADTSINLQEGMARATVNDSMRSELAAHAKHRDQWNGSIITGGTANAQTFSSGNSYTTIPAGMRVLLKIGPTLTNTGAMTLTMDGISAVAVKNQLGRDPGPAEVSADQFVEFLYDGTNWILLAPRQGFVQLDEKVAAASATIEFYPLHTAFTDYAIMFSNVKPVVDDSCLAIRVGTGVGPTWQTAASAYSYGGRVQSYSAGVDFGSFLDSADSFISLSKATANYGVGNSTGEHTSGRVFFPKPDSGDYPLFDWASVLINPAALILHTVGGGFYGGATVITGIQFMFLNAGSSGGIASGTFRMFGHAR